MDYDEVKRRFFEIISETEKGDRARRARSMEDLEQIKEVAYRKSDSPSVALALQAMKATEIREELREIAFSDSISDEDWAAWALMNLSPYSDADILSLANLTVTRNNIKTLFRMEGF